MYRIVQYGKQYKAYDADSQRFVDAGKHLYVTKYKSMKEALTVADGLRQSGYTDIYVEAVG